MNEWYKTHLGFDTTEYGTTFEWRQGEDTTNKGLRNGARLLKQQNILSLQQKNLWLTIELKI